MTPILSSLLTAPRIYKSSFIAAMDIVLLVLAFASALYFVPRAALENIPFGIPLIFLGACLFLLVAFGLHHARLRRFDAIFYGRAVLLAFGFMFVSFLVNTGLDYPLSETATFLFGAAFLFLMTTVRLIASFTISWIEANWHVDTETLLQRRPVSQSNSTVANFFTGKAVLVTGAGGSIGSEICRQISQLKPEKLILFELSESHLFTIQTQLQNSACEIVPILGDVTSAHSLQSLFDHHQIDTVLHAAAYKHVPMVEQNELSGVRNNVFGTRNIIRFATDYGVKNLLLISTDKAVRPTNIMGASKRIAELLVQQAAVQSNHTKLSIVRFGNVLGSSGSVVPYFYDQIKSGGPVTVTHSDITRYFMTIPEAVDLVLNALTLSKGGEVFLLDMGKPVRIIDMARRMISLAGKTEKTPHSPDGDIEIKISGLRPGEKIYEELLIADDAMPTKHPKIFAAHEPKLSEHETARMVRDLGHALTTGNTPALRDAISVWIPEYCPPSEMTAIRKAS